MYNNWGKTYGNSDIQVANLRLHSRWWVHRCVCLQHPPTFAVLHCYVQNSTYVSLLLLQTTTKHLNIGTRRTSAVPVTSNFVKACLTLVCSLLFFHKKLGRESRCIPLWNSMLYGFWWHFGFFLKNIWFQTTFLSIHWQMRFIAEYVDAIGLACIVRCNFLCADESVRYSTDLNDMIALRVLLYSDMSFSTLWLVFSTSYRLNLVVNTEQYESHRYIAKIKYM